MQRLWQFAHNCVAHPVEGLLTLVLGKSPRWVDRLHDWTAAKAWGKTSFAAYPTQAGMMRVFIDLPPELCRDYPEIAGEHAARSLQGQVGRICEWRWGAGVLRLKEGVWTWEKE